MATTVMIDAEYAAGLCKGRLAEIEKQFERDKDEWFVNQRKITRRRGKWPFRYSYYPTDSELEAMFNGTDADGWSRHYCPIQRLRRSSSNERTHLKNIVKAADVAIRADDKNNGDGKISLSGDELAYFSQIE